MSRYFLPRVALNILLFVAPAAEAAHLDPYAAEIWNKLKGPAAADIFRHEDRNMIDCFKQDGREVKCSVASVTSNVDVFYSTPARQGGDLALAIVYYNPDTGNALWFDAVVMLKTDFGYRVIAKVDRIFGTAISATFAGKDILVTTKTLHGDDARCCPTGRTVWKIDAMTGKAVYYSGNQS